MTEAELAVHIVAWLQERGWKVHEEVSCGSVADIVAVMERRIWVVEVKKTMGLAVMSQADAWRRWVHWVSVATPKRKRVPTSSGFEYSVMRDRGIGHFEVSTARHSLGKVLVSLEPKMMRRPDPVWLARMREALIPENEAGSGLGAKAGSAGGGYWTSWKGTCRRIASIVKEKPGVTLKEVLDSEDGFHYSSISSARSALSMQLREGVIEGVRLEKEGRLLKLYPDEQVDRRKKTVHSPKDHS